MSTETATNTSKRAPSKAKVRITLTGSQFSTLALMLLSDHTAKALAEVTKQTNERSGPIKAMGVLQYGVEAREVILAAVDKVKQAVVTEGQQEGIIDV